MTIEDLHTTELCELLDMHKQLALRHRTRSYARQFHAEQILEIAKEIARTEGVKTKETK